MMMVEVERGSDCLGEITQN